MNIQNTGSRNFEKLRRMPHYLDWANMPDPFRHYEGVPILDLPADPPAPQIPALDVLGGKMGTTLARDGAAFLSQLMFYSASISASKRVPSTGSTYALRVNPSSGNLHPTEFPLCSSHNKPLRSSVAESPCRRSEANRSLPAREGFR